MKLDSLNSILEQPIQLSAIELCVLDLPQKTTFKSAIGVRTSREALIIKLYDDEGNVGYGECSCRPDPYYSHEFLDGSIQLIEKFIAPSLGSCRNYNQLVEMLGKIRGWNFTKAAVEFAFNDLLTTKTGTGLLEAWDRDQLKEVPVGISLGIYDDYESMLLAVTNAKKEGYKRLKFKISPTINAQYFIKLRAQIDEEYVCFDANGTFTEKDLDQLAPFVEFGNIIEQPFGPGRLDVFATAKSRFPNLIVCPDEEISNMGQLITAQNAGYLDQLNIKPGRVGGLLNAIEMIEYCLLHSIDAWIGGMFETGIGRSLNVQIASFLQNAEAHDQSPSTRYFEKDVLVEPIEMDDQGFIDISQAKNRAINAEVFDSLTTRKTRIEL